MIPRLTSAIQIFLTSVSSTSRRYTGKSQIRKFGNNSTAIRNVINQALNVTGLAASARKAEANHNAFIAKLRTAKTAYNSWLSAKTLYDQSVSSVRKYSRKLAQARRAKNTTNKKKYAKLLGRARTAKNRRQITMNNKWNAFSTKAQDVGIAFLPVWNSYEDLKTKLLLP